MNDMEWFVWFNNVNTSLEAKIRLGAAAYKKKHGHWPNVCRVHLGFEEDDIPEFVELDCSRQRYVLPNHFWFGTQAEH